MHKGTVVEEVDKGIATFYVENEKGKIVISNNQQNSDDIFLFVGNIVDFNIAFKEGKAEVGDKAIISSIPLSEADRFLKDYEKGKQVEIEIMEISNYIYKCKAKNGSMYLLKRNCFQLTSKPNQLKIAVIQDMIDRENNNRKAKKYAENYSKDKPSKKGSRK